MWWFDILNDMLSVTENDLLANKTDYPGTYFHGCTVLDSPNLLPHFQSLSIVQSTISTRPDRLSSSASRLSHIEWHFFDTHKTKPSFWYSLSSSPRGITAMTHMTWMIPLNGGIKDILFSLLHCSIVLLAFASMLHWQCTMNLLAIATLTLVNTPNDA